MKMDLKMKTIEAYEKDRFKKFNYEDEFFIWNKRNLPLLGIPGPGLEINPLTIHYILFLLLKEKKITFIFFLKAYISNLFDLLKFRLKNFKNQ